MAKEATSGMTSLISRQVVVEGEITGEENLHVDGRINGSIRLTGDLFVGASGVVEADVDVRNIVIQGALIGKVIARQQLEVQTSGRFSGECTAASFQIHEGAVFEGTSKMAGTSSRSGKSLSVGAQAPEGSNRTPEPAVLSKPANKPN